MIDWTQLTDEAFNAEVQRIAQATGFSVAEVKSWAGLKRMGYDDGTPVVDTEPHAQSPSPPFRRADSAL